MMRWLVGLMALAGLAGVAPADVPVPPVRQQVDAHGVDTLSQTFTSSMTDVTIGPAGAHGLAYTRTGNTYGWRGSVIATINSGDYGTGVTVTFGGSSDSFGLYYNTPNNTAVQSSTGNGATLSTNGSNYYTYTSASGVVVQFAPVRGRFANFVADLAYASTVTYPDGTVVQYHYKIVNWCPYQPGDYSGACPQAYDMRLQSVTNSLGYMLKLTYAGNAIPNGDNNDQQIADFERLTQVTGINLAIENCDGDADGCSLSHAWPQASYAADGTVTTPAGTWQYYMDGNGRYNIKRASRPGPDVTVSYNGDGTVSAVTDLGHTWTYGSSIDGNGTRTLYVTDPANQQRIVRSDTGRGLVLSDRDENGLTTSLDYYAHDFTDPVNGFDRLKRVTAPDGNWVEYTYDGRGNVVQTRAHRKGGDPRGDIVSSAGYDGSCGNPKTCNQPLWTKDGRQAQTDYTYDGNTGLVSTVNRPPDKNGVRPYMVYDYTSMGSPWGGTLTLLAGTRTCRTGGWGCGGATVVGQAFSYNGSGGNFLLRTVASGARDGSLYNSVTYDYDDVRNVTAVTDPNGQVWRSGYDGARRKVWTITPDPDGNGGMRGKMTVTNYRGDGMVSSEQVGTGEQNGTGFYEYFRTEYDYDGAGRRISGMLRQGGNYLSATQYGYDGLGRLECTAQRMNPSAYGSLPGACDLSTQGADGPDRISRVEYDAGSRVTRTWSGYRTAQAVHVDQEWTNNNKLHRVYDQAGDPNQRGPATTYEYDGFDRLRYTCYNATVCPGASDYEQYDYDDTGNLTWRRLRDGNVTTAEYDGLGRLTKRTPPAYTYRDQPATYDYDNLGHLTQATLNTGLGSMSVSLTYDALGRLTQEVQPWSAVGYGYDAAGNRTYVGYGDGYWVRYNYDALGRMKDVIEKDQFLMAQYFYDEMGRVQTLGRANNGAHTYFAYGNTPWLTSMTNDLNGTASDLTASFGYNAAGQIVRKDTSNEAYAWAQGYNVNRSYDVNALNQYTRSGATNLGYDARGNLNNGDTGGSLAYAYDADNLLTHATIGGQVKTFNYDALGRLSLDQADNRRFGYAGSQLLHELDGNNSPQAHYVYGLGEAPLVRYDGGYNNRRWLYTDERGSVIAEADDGGNKTQINSYDEYGIPAATNAGRFGYTGQMWLPSVNLWHYKARTYSPTLGRFLQTDPIGYGDGLNWYNYVGGDPVNGTDPSGTACRVSGSYAIFQQLIDGGIKFLGHYGTWFMDIDRCRDESGGLRQADESGAGGAPSATANSFSTMTQNNNQKKVDCNSGARQLVNFANNVSLAAGGSALVFGALGAEPVAAGLAGGALVADGVSFIAGGYVYLTEGDSGPLKSSFAGAALGAVGGVGAKVFGGSSRIGLGGVRVSKAASDTTVEASKLAAGQAGGAAPAQVCR